MSSVSEFGKDLCLMGEVIVTGRKAGFTARDYGALAHSEETMRKLRLILNGYGSMETDPHVVDGDAAPITLRGTRVDSHMPTGFFKWDPMRIQTFVTRAQLDRREATGVNGWNLRRLLQGMPVFNMNILEFIRKNKELAPEEWKRFRLYAWGTILVSDEVFVPGIKWAGWGWDWCGKALYNTFGTEDAALVLAP